VQVGRLELHVAELGSGPPLLLLHGFPAHWVDWREQMEALAASGFRVIAPDLPGYGESECLPRVADYRATLLADDLAGLIRALDLERVHVLGHDWGGTLAYCLATQYPELVDRLIIINAGHPELFRSALRRFSQLRRSWYIFLFQLPFLPEWLVRRRAVIALCTRGMEVRAGAFSEGDLDSLLKAMRAPGAARAALSYYRAAARAPIRAQGTLPHRTLVLWGERDGALSSTLLLDGLERLVPNARIARFANAGHWLHHDLPAVVTRHVVQFLSATTES
jgi:pimeloyl-ACP methyl ester carboxylesterase